jgi:hypothetical protein
VLQQYTGISVYIAIRNPHIVLRYDFRHTGTKILQTCIYISFRKAIQNNDTLYQGKQNKAVFCKNKLLRKKSIIQSSVVTWEHSFYAFKRIIVGLITHN